MGTYIAGSKQEPIDRFYEIDISNIAAGAPSAEQVIEIERNGRFVMRWCFVSDNTSTLVRNHYGSFKILLNDEPLTNQQFISAVALSGGGEGIDGAPCDVVVKKGDKLRVTLLSLIPGNGPTINGSLIFGQKYE